MMTTRAELGSEHFSPRPWLANRVQVRVTVTPGLRLDGGEVGSAITTLDKKACEGLV